MRLKTDNFINDLNRWAKAYKNHILALSYSKNTIELYERAIDQFIEYSLQYQDEMTMKDIKSIYITGFLSYLEEQAKLKGKKPKNGMYLSKSTKATYLKAIKNFFSFISDNNDEFFTFDRYFKNIRVADSSGNEEKIEYLTEDEIERLLNILEREKSKKGSYSTYRNALLIKLLLYSGLRISEALNLKLEDFKEENNDSNFYHINIYGKGGKDQSVVIAKRHIEDELNYFKEKEEGGFIMKSRSGKQLNRTNAYTIVNNIYLKAGIYTKKGLHLLRHTLAMRLTLKDVNPIVIQKILRHKNLATTTVYAKATNGAIKNAVDF